MCVCSCDETPQSSHWFIQLVFSPVVNGQADIFCAVLQGDVGVLGAELDVLTAGVGHRERQSHGLELLSCGLVVSDVHQARDEILINLQNKSQLNIRTHLLHAFVSL